MSFLRTISTRRLLALLAGALLVAGGGAAIAFAATGGEGPLPPVKRLAVAVRDALAAPAPNGVTARIEFTNHLIDSASIEGSDPILTGATGRLWASGDRFRLELQSEQGDAQVVLNGARFWIYDGRSNTLYRGRLPHRPRERAKHSGVPSVKRIQREIGRLMEHARLSGAVPANVAGRPAYRVTVSPKHDGGLLGSASLAWDALRGVPLRAAVYAQGSSSPVLELRATDISYGNVSAGSFAIAPPAHAHTVELSPGPARRERGRGRELTGLRAVSGDLPFRLAAPGRVARLPRHDVRLLEWDGKPAALVTYGRGLGGIVVIERRADPSERAPLLGGGGERGGRHGLSLPHVTIGGAAGQQLTTALGTAISFRRGGVDYAVLGSVPPAVAVAAARGL